MFHCTTIYARREANTLSADLWNCERAWDKRICWISSHIGCQASTFLVDTLKKICGFKWSLTPGGTMVGIKCPSGSNMIPLANWLSITLVVYITVQKKLRNAILSVSSKLILFESPTIGWQYFLSIKLICVPVGFNQLNDTVQRLCSQFLNIRWIIRRVSPLLLEKEWMNNWSWPAPDTEAYSCL